MAGNRLFGEKTNNINLVIPDLLLQNINYVTIKERSFTKSAKTGESGAAASMDDAAGGKIFA